MKEKGGFAFISTVKLHFSLVFWVRNAWKMWFSRYRSKIKHFSLVSNPKYAGKVNFTVSKNKPTHFLHLCGNPSKKIVIVELFSNVLNIVVVPYTIHQVQGINYRLQLLYPLYFLPVSQLQQQSFFRVATLQKRKLAEIFSAKSAPSKTTIMN